MLTAKRDMTAVQHFFGKAMGANGDLDKGWVSFRSAPTAGVSNATLHNRYPALVEHIRQLQLEDGQAKTDRQRSELAELKRQNKDLQSALAERTAELKKIAIINLRLSLELKDLRSKRTATVTSISKSKKG